MTTQLSTIEMVAAERTRQLSKGYTSAHDDTHVAAECARAGISYGITAIWQMFGIDGSDVIAPGNPDRALEWPWEDDTYAPEDDAMANLIKAAALICAEVDRLRRKSGDG